MVPESFPGIFFHQQLHDLAALLVALRLSLALDTLCVRRSQLSFLDLSSVVEGPFCLPSPRDHAGNYNLEHLIILCVLCFPEKGNLLEGFCHKVCAAT